MNISSHTIAASLQLNGNNPAFVVELQKFMADTSSVLQTHRNLPIIIDGVNQVISEAPTKDRSAVFKRISYCGSDTGFQAREGPPTILVISTNFSLYNLVGRSSEYALISADRILTLSVSPGSNFGIFDKLPKEYLSSSDYAASVLRSAQANHGVAGRQFIKRLVAARTKKPVALKNRLNGYVDKFIEKTGIDRNKGGDVRLTKQFAALYAAGQLAQDYKVLPKSWKCGHAIMACYRAHVQSPSAPQPFIDRIKALAQDSSIIDLSAENTNTAIKDASVFINKTSKGLELLIRSAAIENILPDWKQLQKSQAVAEVITREKSHWTVQRAVGPGGKEERVYCFKLPASN